MGSSRRWREDVLPSSLRKVSVKMMKKMWIAVFVFVLASNLCFAGWVEEGHLNAARNQFAGCVIDFVFLSGVIVLGTT